MKPRPLPPPTRTSSTPKPSASPTRTDWLFAHFAAFFGQKWADAWGDGDLGAIKAVWESQLARFDDATIRKALDAMLAQGRAWPPTLPEFFEACASFRPTPAGQWRPQLVEPRTPAPPGALEALRAYVDKVRVPAQGPRSSADVEAERQRQLAALRAMEAQRKQAADEQ